MKQKIGFVASTFTLLFIFASPVLASCPGETSYCPGKGCVEGGCSLALSSLPVEKIPEQKGKVLELPVDQPLKCPDGKQPKPIKNSSYFYCDKE